MIQTVPVKFKTFPECAENHDERFFFLYKLQALIIYGLFFLSSRLDWTHKLGPFTGNINSLPNLWLSLYRQMYTVEENWSWMKTNHIKNTNTGLPLLSN